MNKTIKKTCGGCQYWIKIKNNMLCKGICGLHDYSCGSSSSCGEYKAKSYSRQQPVYDDPEGDE